MIITLTKKVERIQRLRALFKELEECIEGSPLPPTEISGVYRDTVIFEGKEIDKELLVVIDDDNLKSCIKRLKTEMNIALKY